MKAAAPGLLGAFALVVYVLTLHPSVPGGDSGELIVAAHTLGISHPPGYPLHALLGHALTCLPVNSIGWRVNLLSALCDAGAVALLALAVAEWTECAWAGLLAGALFAFAPGTWNYAVVAEVFALNNLLVCGLLFAAVRFDRTASFRWALLAAFIVGLGVTNHHTLFLYALPLVVWALWRGRATLLAPVPLALLVAAALAGTLPCLYLPWATSRCPPLFWGDTTTVGGFLDHLLRRHVGTLNLAPSAFGPPQPLVQESHEFTSFVVGQTLLLGVPLAILGQLLSCVSRERRSLGIAAIAAFYLYFFVFHLGANLPIGVPFYLGIQERFWQQPLILICAWIGHCAAWTFRRMPNRAVPGLVFALAGAQLLFHVRACDQHDNRHVENYGRALLDGLEPGSLLLLSGDLNTNSVWYLQYCEGHRADVLAVDLSRLTWPWAHRWMACAFPSVKLPGERYFPGAPGGYALADVVRANASERPVYLRGGVPLNDRSLQDGFQPWPYGLCVRLMPPGSTVDFERWLADSRARYPSCAPPPVERYPASTWEYALIDELPAARHTRAQRILLEAMQHGNDQRLLRLARDELEDILPRFTACPAQLYKDLGAVYSRQKPLDAAGQRRMVEVLWTYVKVGPREDPERAEIEASLRRLTGR